MVPVPRLQDETDTCPDRFACEIAGLVLVPLTHLGKREDAEGLYAGEVVMVLLPCQETLRLRDKCVAEADLGDQLGRRDGRPAGHSQDGIHQSLGAVPWPAFSEVSHELWLGHHGEAGEGAREEPGKQPLDEFCIGCDLGPGVRDGIAQDVRLR